MENNNNDIPTISLDELSNTTPTNNENVENTVPETTETLAPVDQMQPATVPTPEVENQIPQPQVSNTPEVQKTVEERVVERHVEVPKISAPNLYPTPEHKENTEVQQQPQAQAQPVDAAEPQKKESKAKYVILILFMLALCAFVIFLPQISEYVSRYTDQKAVPTTGVSGDLVCTLEKEDENTKLTYEDTFTFIEDKLTIYNHVETINSTDTNVLKESLDTCNNINKELTDVNGINVTCNQTTAIVTTNQKITYNNFEKDKASAAFVEAGATLLGFEQDDSINTIRTTMASNGYNCEEKLK